MNPLAFKHRSICFLVSLLILCIACIPQAYAQRRGGKSVRAKGVTGSNAPSRAEDSRVTKLLDEGFEHAEGGNWDEAIRAYRQAIALDPRNAEAFIGMGDAYMRAGKVKEGFAAYHQAVRVAPWNADAHYSLGAAHNEMAQFGDAFKPFVEAIRLDPEYAEAYFGIGYAYQWLQNYKDALGYLKQAIRLKPDLAEAHLSLGLTYLGMNDAKSAEAQLRILEELDASLASQLKKEMGTVGGASAAAANAPMQSNPVREESKSPVATQRRETVASSSKPTPTGAQPNTDKRTATAAPTPKRAQQTGDAASLLAVELSFWESIKNSSDAEEFAAYLRKYPEGQFAELARIRMRALEPKSKHAGLDVDKLVASAMEQSKPSQETRSSLQEPSNNSEPQAQATQEQAQPAQESAQVVVAAPNVIDEPSEPSPAASLKEMIDWIRKNFANKFTYQSTTVEDSSSLPTTSEVKVDYEPLKIEGCRMDWRDLDDTLSVSLAELDPASVKVEPRSRPNTTFSIEVWNLSITAFGGAGAIRELKGDGSGAINVYSGLDLQFKDKAQAERLARALQSAIKICHGKSE